MSLGDRFDKFLVQVGHTPEEFADAIGVGKSAIYKLKRGDTKKITRSMANKIHLAFPEYSEVFILSLNQDKPDVAPSESYFREPSIIYEPSKDEFIELQKFKIEALEKELKECRQQLFFKDSKVPRDN